MGSFPESDVGQANIHGSPLSPVSGSWFVPRYWTMLGCCTVHKNSHSNWNLPIGRLCSLLGASWVNDC